MATNKVIFGGETVIDLTADTVTADKMLSGYTAHDKSGNRITGTVATATQATPSISVSSGGLITASATQSAGYVASGTKSATKQLTVQAAKTVTPTTSNQTAVDSGRYTTGAVTVKGDANLVAGNIKSGVSIFGVAGTHTGSEDLSAEITEYTRLNALLETTIDSLPDAGSGGGGGVETCTIKIIDNTGYSGFFTIDFTVLQNDGRVGRFRHESTGSGTTMIDNVVCGSVFVPNLQNFNYAGLTWSYNNIPFMSASIGYAPDSSSVIGEIIAG